MDGPVSSMANTETPTDSEVSRKPVTFSISMVTIPPRETLQPDYKQGFRDHRGLCWSCSSVCLSIPREQIECNYPSEHEVRFRQWLFMAHRVSKPTIMDLLSLLLTGIMGRRSKADVTSSLRGAVITFSVSSSMRCTGWPSRKSTISSMMCILLLTLIAFWSRPSSRR